MTSTLRNSKSDDEMLDDSDEAVARAVSSTVSGEQLRLFIERIERLEEEKKGIADDVKDVYSEAKSTGFDAPTMRKIVALRKMEKHKRDEADALLDTYKIALGLA